MRRALHALLRDYGSCLTLMHDGAQTQLRAFLQPVTSKSWQNMEHVFEGLGEVPRGQYLYIGPTIPALCAGDELTLEDHTYLVRRADTLQYRDKPLYIWALCVRKGGDDVWNS